MGHEKLSLILGWHDIPSKMFDAKNDSVASYATISPFEGTLNIICVAQNDAGSSHRFGPPISNIIGNIWPIWYRYESYDIAISFGSYDMSHVTGDSSKWNMFDHRRVLCYYSKMHFNQVWRTWKSFDLDSTRNTYANWIWIAIRTIFKLMHQTYSLIGQSGLRRLHLIGSRPPSHRIKLKLNLSIRNNVKNRSYHWCRATVIVRSI